MKNESQENVTITKDEKKEEEEVSLLDALRSPKPNMAYVNRNASSELLDFTDMSREQLVIEATRLQKHVVQLKNLLAKANLKQWETERIIGTDAVKNILSDKKLVIRDKKFKHRPFDFSKHHKRHILLKFAYLGWNYKVYLINIETF
jgi:hypothetical protein